MRETSLSEEQTLSQLHRCEGKMEVKFMSFCISNEGARPNQTGTLQRSWIDTLSFIGSIAKPNCG